MYNPTDEQMTKLLKLNEAFGIETNIVQPIEVYVKLLNSNAKMPKKNRHDAGWDLCAVEDVVINGGERKTVKTGIALEIPEDWVGLIWPRSGLAAKSGVDILAGVIDSSYRGEISVCLLNTSTALPLYETPKDVATHIKRGDRIAQILFQPVPNLQLKKVDDLNDTVRGAKGFGSSGK